VNPYFQDKDPVTGRALGLVGMVRKYQPDVIMNPRSGWCGDYNSEEGGAPVTGPVRTRELYEKCMSITPVWGYTRDLEDPAKLMSLPALKRMLADCVVRNMALLLNVGPDRHGRITKAETDLLLHMGEWLGQVGNAVYGTRGGPWDPKDGQYGFAWKDNTIYIYLLGHYNDSTLTLPALHNGQHLIRAFTVAGNKPVKARRDGRGQIILSGLDNHNGDIDIIAVELDKKVVE
jgi:alpha-L-fucosidase